MPKKRSIFSVKCISFGAAIDEFIDSRKALGCATATIENYRRILQKVWYKFIPSETPVQDITLSEINAAICKMRDSDRTDTTMQSYVNNMSIFMTYCAEKGYTTVTIPKYKATTPIKETYTDAELKKLLKKPDMKHTDFTEFRTWVIINLLVNSGARAGTIRAIRNKDVDLQNGFLSYRHTKNKKTQIVPLCSEMISILKAYMHIRKGNNNDYLFVQVSGEPLTDRALSQSIARYNKRRGVEKTSVHMFRHTFARKFLLDCNGDAFRLQKLLGHSTLAMTKHYCEIYNADILRDYDRYSPLHQMYTNNKKHVIKMRDDDS